VGRVVGQQADTVALTGGKQSVIVIVHCPLSAVSRIEVVRRDWEAAGTVGLSSLAGMALGRVVWSVLPGRPWGAHLYSAGGLVAGLVIGEVWAGQERMLWYSLVGMVIGALPGAFIGGAACQNDPDDWLQLCPEVGVAVGAGIGAGVGLLGGTVVGFTTGAVRWVPIPLDDVRMGLAPLQSGDTGLGLSVSF
jgi:hypothetical protein